MTENIVGVDQKISEVVKAVNPDLNKLGISTRFLADVVVGKEEGQEIKRGAVAKAQLMERDKIEGGEYNWGVDEFAMICACSHKDKIESDEDMKPLAKVMKVVNEEANIGLAESADEQEYDWLGTAAALVFPDNEKHRRALSWIMFSEGYRQMNPEAETEELENKRLWSVNQRLSLQNKLVVEFPLVSGHRSFLTRSLMIMAYLSKQDVVNQDLAIAYMDALIEEDPALSSEKEEKIEDKVKPTQQEKKGDADNPARPRDLRL